ncbi:MAG: hypothetical protein JOZ11_17165 [Alphaproteobacteria bacterium]|nr:hypothetical protein [Alphaproteobacteria bacterium]
MSGDAIGPVIIGFGTEAARAPKASAASTMIATVATRALASAMGNRHRKSVIGFLRVVVWFFFAI